MSDILLVFPKLYEKELKMVANFPPLNLMFLTAPLEEAGYKVDMIDCRLTPEYEKKIRLRLSKKPVLVGITCMTGYQIIWALKIAELVRQANPDVPIVWGGVHPTLLAQQTIQNPLVDIIVKNEGEITLVELAQTLEAGRSLKDVKGIVYKENGQVVENKDREWVNMRSLPMPAWHAVKKDIKAYMQKGCLRIHSSRGCPHKCSFCYNKGYNKGHWSAMPAEKMCDEIEFLMREFNVNTFHFVDDNFLSNRKRAVDFCKEIKKRNLKIKWGFSIRIDYVKEPLIGILAEAGMHDCFVGVESGSQKILDQISKGIRVDDIKTANLLLKKYNIKGRYSFMLGFPFEEYDDVVKTSQLALELYEQHPDTEFSINNYTPYPGTDMYELAKELPGFYEPQSLEEWGDCHWAESESLARSCKYNFENTQLMWSLTLTKLNKFPPVSRPLIALLQKWAHYRLKRGFLKNTIEFYLLKQVGKIISPF